MEVEMQAADVISCEEELSVEVFSYHCDSFLDHTLMKRTEQCTA